MRAAYPVIMECSRIVSKYHGIVTFAQDTQAWKNFMADQTWENYYEWDAEHYLAMKDFYYFRDHIGARKYGWAGTYYENIHESFRKRLAGEPETVDDPD